MGLLNQRDLRALRGYNGNREKLVALNGLHGYDIMTIREKISVAGRV